MIDRRPWAQQDQWSRPASPAATLYFKYNREGGWTRKDYDSEEKREQELRRLLAQLYCFARLFNEPSSFGSPPARATVVVDKTDLWASLLLGDGRDFYTDAWIARMRASHMEPIHTAGYWLGRIRRWGNPVAPSSSPSSHTTTPDPVEVTVEEPVVEEPRLDTKVFVSGPAEFREDVVVVGGQSPAPVVGWEHGSPRSGAYIGGEVVGDDDYYSSYIGAGHRYGCG